MGRCARRGIQYYMYSSARVAEPYRDRTLDEIQTNVFSIDCSACDTLQQHICHNGKHPDGICTSKSGQRLLHVLCMVIDKRRNWGMTTYLLRVVHD